jgi:RNA polymerase-binding transcription factor DksA
MPGKSDVTPAQAVQFGEVLRTRLGELSHRVDVLETERRQPVDDDLAEQALEREADETADALEYAALEESAAIEAALRRIEDGTYGRCVSCGGSIGLQRLQFVPAAALCITCAGGILDS